MLRISLLVVALAAGAVAGGTALLHLAAADVGEETASARTPLPQLVTRPLARVDSFERAARYAGRIEAARETTLAFEQAGEVVEVVVDEGASLPAGAVVARQDVRIREAERRRLVAEREALAAEIALAERTEQRQRTLEGRGYSATQAYDEARFGRSRLVAQATAVDAAIVRIDVEIEKAVLRAPFAGTIATRYVDEGTVAAGGQPIVDLVETGRLEARIGVPPEVARRLPPGAELAVAAGSEGPVLEAQLLARRPDLEGRTRTVQLRLAIDPGWAPPLGTLVTLELSEQVLSHGFWVPTRALESGPKGLLQIPLAIPDGDDWQRSAASVQVVHAETDRAFVDGPVPADAELVVAGAHRVPLGAAVARVLEPAR